MNKPSSNLITKPKWDWTQVDCNLKLEISKKFTNWSLAPHIVLTSPSGEGPDPTVKLFIDTEKSLQFNQESQWNWHKSWNLPNISVRVEVKDSSTGEALLAPKKLFVQLFAVKAVPEPHEKQEATHLVDVGIRGNSKHEIEDGQAFFTAMKFSSTSYNHEGVKFYLLLVLYIQNGAPTDTPKIITSIVSPPIFVDSRKSARDNHQKKNQSFIEPFLVQNLEKEYIKRENKKRSEHEIKIKNDFEGLFNYLTAPNIRHKVKHPLFIAIKFSQCAKLFFNTLQTGKEITLPELVNALQRKISKDHYSRHVAKSSLKPEERMFVLQIMVTNDESKRKKVCESIDPVECSSLGIVYGSDELPSHFENFSSLGNMSTVYKDEYSQLYITTRSIFDAQASEGEGENEESSSDEEKKEDEGDGDDQEKSESDKDSSYPEYNPEKPAVEHIPVLEKKKIEAEVVQNQAFSNPPENVVAPADTFYKRSFSEPVVKKQQVQRNPIQVPIPEVSLPSKEVPQQIMPNMPQNPLLSYGMNQPFPNMPNLNNNYLGEMSMEQLYLNNLMLSSAISNLKPAYSGRMPSNNIPATSQVNNIPNIPNMPNMTGMGTLQNMGNVPNMGMYNMMRPNMESSRQHNSYAAMNELTSMMMNNPQSIPSNAGFNQSQSTITPTTPSKVGFSPTVQQSQQQAEVNLSQLAQQMAMNSISQMGQGAANQMNDQQYMMMKQQVYKELYMQLWQTQRGMMPGQQMMPNMGASLPPNMNNNLAGMGGSLNPSMMSPSMGTMGMGQMNPMTMNPYMFMPEGMGYPQPKSQNK